MICRVLINYFIFFCFYLYCDGVVRGLDFYDVMSCYCNAWWIIFVDNKAHAL